MLPLVCEVLGKKLVSVLPIFRGGYAADFGHTFSNGTHIRACGRFLPERDYLTFGSLLSQIRLSVCRLSVTLVPLTQEVEPFGNMSSPLCTLGHPLTSVQNFEEIVQNEPLRRGVKRKRGSEIERFRAYQRLYLINGTR